MKVVRLRRNFGQTAALQAGIDFSRGEVLVTMDGDLQNDPADIPILLQKLSEGYDAVLGLRANRQDHLLIRKVPSALGNWLIRKVTGVPIRDLGCTLRALRHDLAEALPLYGEMHRFIPVLAQNYGARMCQVEVEGSPKLVIACNMPIREGMVVRTTTPAVQNTRRGVMELLLVNHPLDCPICDKAGECVLQDY